MSTTHCLLHGAVILWKYVLIHSFALSIHIFYAEWWLASFRLCSPCIQIEKLFHFSSELRHNASWTGYTFASTLQAIDFNYKIIILIIVSIKTLFNCIIMGELAVALPKNGSVKKGESAAAADDGMSIFPKMSSKIIGFCLRQTKNERHDEKRQFLISFWLMMMNPIRH